MGTRKKEHDCLVLTQSFVLLEGKQCRSLSGHCKQSLLVQGSGKLTLRRCYLTFISAASLISIPQLPELGFLL